MAHHIAELIAECDGGGAAKSKAVKERCAAAILDLWAHRASLTGASRPFQDLAPIIETLRALDPEAEHLFYRRLFPNCDISASEETAKWLNFAKNCDAIARMLINIGVDRAAEHASDVASGWAEAASQAGLASDLDIQISDLLDGRLSEEARDSERRVLDLEGRIKKLDAFSDLASELRADLKRQLTALEEALNISSSAARAIKGCQE